MTEAQIFKMKAGRKASAGKTRKASGHTVRTADGGRSEAGTRRRNEL